MSEIEIYLTFWQRVKLRIFGYTYLASFQKTGWKNCIRYYVFKCSIHGRVMNYPQGHYKILKCPYCGEVNGR